MFFGVIALLLLLPQSAPAAPPNDNFVDAAELSGLPAEATGSNVDATREPGEPNHGNQGGEHSIWFKWTAPRDVGVTLTYQGCAPPFQDSTSVSASLVVYSKTEVFGLVQVAGVAQAFRATAGETYWIAADTLANQTDPDICVRLVPGPPNDDFAQATALTGFPVIATSGPQDYRKVTGPTVSNEGGPTSEPGEPFHGGERPASSVWYRWSAAADGPVLLRACGAVGILAVYTGDRVDALTNVASRRPTPRGCGNEQGASMVVNATSGETYRIAIASLGGSGIGNSLALLVGSQVAVLNRHGRPFFSYTAFAGQSDLVALRLAGSGRDRAVLLEARGVTAAAGCQPEPTPGRLRCPMPGRVAPILDIDLGDGNDTADIRLLAPTAPSFDDIPLGGVSGGPGNDTLRGSAGSFHWTYGWSGGLRMFGGQGADRLLGGNGVEVLRGGPGADSLAGGRGDDSISGGAGSDEVDAGAGSDSVDGGPGDDRIRSADGSSDIVRCNAGQDRARIDGSDLPDRCERRNLVGAARAVATGATVEDDNGEGEDHLVVFISCPVDARSGCRARITPAVQGERRISRRLNIAPGRGGTATFLRFDEDALVRRGVRVTVSTRRPGGRTLRFATRLRVFDNRYEGE